MILLKQQADDEAALLGITFPLLENTFIYPLPDPLELLTTLFGPSGIINDLLAATKSQLLEAARKKALADVAVKISICCHTLTNTLKAAQKSADGIARQATEEKAKGLSDAVVKNADVAAKKAADAAIKFVDGTSQKVEPTIAFGEARVLFDFEATESTDLRLFVGETVLLLEEYSADWFKGSIGTVCQTAIVL